MTGGRIVLFIYSLPYTADLFLGIPPHWGPGIVRGTPLADASGWIQADPETLRT